MTQTSDPNLSKTPVGAAPPRRARIVLYAIILLLVLVGLRARGRTLWERTP